MQSAEERKQREHARRQRELARLLEPEFRPRQVLVLGDEGLAGALRDRQIDAWGLGADGEGGRWLDAGWTLPAKWPRRYDLVVVQGEDVPVPEALPGERVLFLAAEPEGDSPLPAWAAALEEAGLRRDFGWNTALTFSHNKNTITYVENPSTTASALIKSQFLEGYPTSALFSYRFAGINDEGQHTWYLPDGTTTTSISSAPVEAVVYSGQTDPKVVSSMENTFSWNGLSLSVLMVYYGGHKMRALEEQETYHVPYGPVASYFLNAWTPEHPTNTPGIGQWSSTSGIGSEALYTDAYVRPADFLKIRNIVLSYELPEMWLEKIRLQRASVSFQLNNPKWLWVKNKVGIDPETLSLRDPSSFVFGLNINI